MNRLIRANILLHYVVRSGPGVGTSWHAAYQAALHEASEALNAQFDIYYPLPKAWRQHA